jgi:hypothetical protein
VCRICNLLVNSLSASAKSGRSLATILPAAREAASMAHRMKSKRSKGKTILRLPDLELSKNAVLHSLAAASSQESYGHAIDEFIEWYCSEPRLAFNRTVVLR